MIVHVDRVRRLFNKAHSTKCITHDCEENKVPCIPLLSTNKTPCYIDYRCVTFIRIKFIELQSPDTTTVTVALPLICPWTVALASAIERPTCATSNRTGVTSCCCCCFFFTAKRVSTPVKKIYKTIPLRETLHLF